MTRLSLIPLLSLTLPFGLQAADAPPPAGHPHHAAATGATASAGRKMELIEGITSDDFLRLSNKPNTVELVIVAVFSDENYGMNFNGYAKGLAIYTIPKGWTVEINFINPGPVPHSLVVIEKDSVKKLQVPEPYFKGAAVPEHLKGIAFAKSSFSFVADEAGEFALACGFPAHTLNGHWIALDISEEAKVPTLKLGTAEAKLASPAKSK